jgi:hypothetical protein
LRIETNMRQKIDFDQKIVNVPRCGMKADSAFLRHRAFCRGVLSDLDSRTVNPLCGWYFST